MNNSSLNNPTSGKADYSAIYTVGAFPFTAPSKCIITGYVNSVNAYIDIYAKINGHSIKVKNTNIYAHTGFSYVLESKDTITFTGQVDAANCTIIPLKQV